MYPKNLALCANLDSIRVQTHNVEPQVRLRAKARSQSVSGLVPDLRLLHGEVLHDLLDEGRA